jgi:two-component system phosphate regulon sensor histidine kinase PhoR
MSAWSNAFGGWSMRTVPGKEIRMARASRWARPSLAVVLIVLILLPVLIFSAFELFSMNATERMLTETYDRQLDGVLSSLNQFAWDHVSGWAAMMNRSLREGVPMDSLLAAQIEYHQSVEGAFLADSAGKLIGLRMRRSNDTMQRKIQAILKNPAASFARLVKLRLTGYTRLVPVLLDSLGGDFRVALLFAAERGPQEFLLAGFIIEPERIARDELGPRLQETAGSDFVVAVFRKGTQEAIYSTDQTGLERITQRRSLWVFPQLELGIRFRGSSAEDLAASRSRQLVIMVVALDLLLLTGAWLTYRNVRRETELAKLKSDFVSNVSHELRTPLALIRMYAETLEMGRIQQEEKIQEYYATIVSESGRLTRLVNNILNFSRMEAGRMPFTFRPADLNDVVRGSLEVWREHLREGNVAVDEHLDPSLPAVAVDAEAAGEALMNLIDNALKYGGEQKYLLLATGTEGNRVYIRVGDHGIGIAQKDHQKIFEMFYRASGSVRDGMRGSGVGLAIVRHIMEAHGGTVTLQSTPGAGSTFTLWFPKST